MNCRSAFSYSSFTFAQLVRRLASREAFTMYSSMRSRYAANTSSFNAFSSCVSSASVGGASGHVPSSVW